MILFIGVGLVAVWWLFFVSIDYFLRKRNPESEQIGIEFLKSDITVLIAARNEERDIYNCLESISAEMQETRISVLLVNDHSTDNTLMEVDKAILQFQNIDVSVIENVEHGKKAALSLGLKQVKTKLIYLTDADCQIQSGTFNFILKRMNHGSFAAILGVVEYEVTSWFSRLIALENWNNMAVTEALTKAGKPILSNAGNFMFQTKFLPLFQESLESKFASGDDMFFLEKLTAQGEKIGFEKNAVVKTNAPETLIDLFAQRVRWAGKSTGYNNWLAKAIPAFVWLMNSAFISWMIVSVVFDHFLLWGLFPFCLKVLIEYAFHAQWFKRYEVKHRLFDGIALSTVYPIYVVIIGLMALLKPSFTWKGRRYVGGLRP
jgi:cellulose synthase/poly-beta-1,6-N-acetylglucosamine synthase-like glycosyltransferase